MSTNVSLAIRFGGQPLPDVPLDLLSTTSIAVMKYQIRARIPSSYAEHAIKLIYNGRQLKNQLAIGKELGITATVGQDSKKVWYVHCALPLAQDQGWENDEARSMFGDPTAIGAGSFEAELSKLALTEEPSEPTQHGPPAAPLPAAPNARGFDRLRTIQSFTTTDITSMRGQFRANISARHTPETMPTEEQMLRMEDRWLDNSAFSSSLAAVARIVPSTTELGADASTGPQVDEASQRNPELIAAQQLLAPAVAELEAEDDASRALDDTLLGVVSGFFWPIGAVVWGLREDGVWSRRRSWSVLAGVMVNLCFGIVRIMG